jgi:hypothetical protein
MSLARLVIIAVTVGVEAKARSLATTGSLGSWSEAGAPLPVSAELAVGRARPASTGSDARSIRANSCPRLTSRA